MVRVAAVLGLVALSGCTSVKLVQRDGCWVRRMERWPGGQITEELGPCTAPAPPWSEDRVSRAVQECVARADHRWQTQAQMAWSRGKAAPEQTEREDAIYRACLDEPTKALSGENDLLRRKNEELQQRLAELAKERDAVRSSADEERARREDAEKARLAAQEKMTDRLLTAQEKVGDRLFRGQDAMAGYLGEAAKKSSQPAVATATSNSHSDGSATTESASSSPGAPTAPVATTARAAPRPSPRAAPACAPAPVGARTAGACPPPKATAATAATAAMPAPSAPPRAEVAQGAASGELPTAAPASAGAPPVAAGPTGAGEAAQEPAPR